MDYFSFNNSFYNILRENVVEDIDRLYMKAVESGDEKRMETLVKHVANQRGYAALVYHGTDQFGFTVPDVKKSDDEISFFMTNTLDCAKTYSDGLGDRPIRIDYKNEDGLAYNLTYDYIQYTFLELEKSIRQQGIEVFRKSVADEISNNDATSRFLKIMGTEWYGHSRNIIDAIYHSTENYNPVALNILRDVIQDLNKIRSNRMSITAECPSVNEALSDVAQLLEKHFTKWRSYLPKTNLSIIDDQFEFLREELNTETEYDTDIYTIYLFVLKGSVNFILNVFIYECGALFVNALLDENLLSQEMHEEIFTGISLGTDTLDDLLCETFGDIVNDAFSIIYDNVCTKSKSHDSIKKLENYFMRNLFRTQNSGVYKLYINTHNLFVVNGFYADWKHVPCNLKRWKNYDSNTAKTRIIAKYAKTYGYDGAMIKDIWDDGGTGLGQSSASTVFIVFKPQTQIKSADLITYDDNGNVIPLSQRFNPDNPDIRY